MIILSRHIGGLGKTLSYPESSIIIIVVIVVIIIIIIIIIIIKLNWGVIVPLKLHNNRESLGKMGPKFYSFINHLTFCDILV